VSASERIAAGLAALVLSASALAQAVPQASASAPMHQHGSHAAAACSSPDLACAKSATAVFDSSGALWVAWTAGGSVSVARSTDAGATSTRKRLSLDSQQVARQFAAVHRANPNDWAQHS
jgi:hypothetical protein